MKIKSYEKLVRAPKVKRIIFYFQNFASRENYDYEYDYPLVHG